jgi:transcriptional regulator with XRE-family HTH domain
VQERIFALMEREGINAVELGKATGVSNKTISAWKNGGKEPSANSIIKIAEYFGVTADYLLTGKEYAPIEPLIIPDILKNAKVAASGGEDDWTQDDIDDAAVVYEILLTRRKQKKL